MTTLFVKPREGGRVRQPERRGQVMPDDGAFVPRDAYYERLLIAGDVIEATPPARQAQAEPAATAAEDTISRNQKAAGSSRRTDKE